MQRISPKFHIAAWTLFLSSIFSMSIGCNSHQTSDDSNIYQATICDLAEKPKEYDGKLVQVKAIHGGLGIDTPTFLSGFNCDQEIWATCKMDGDSCVKMYNRLRSTGGVKDPQALPQIEAVGRFTADAELPQMLAGSEKKRGKLFEITELKGIEAIRK